MRVAKLLLVPTGAAWIAGYLTCVLTTTDVAHNLGQHLVLFFLAGTALVLPSFLLWTLPSTLIALKKEETNQQQWSSAIDIAALVVGYCSVVLITQVMGQPSPIELVVRNSVPFFVYALTVALLKARLIRELVPNGKRANQTPEPTAAAGRGSS